MKLGLPDHEGYTAEVGMLGGMIIVSFEGVRIGYVELKLGPTYDTSAYHAHFFNVPELVTTDQAEAIDYICDQHKAFREANPESSLIEQRLAK